MSHEISHEAYFKEKSFGYLKRGPERREHDRLTLVSERPGAKKFVYLQRGQERRSRPTLVLHQPKDNFSLMYIRFERKRINSERVGEAISLILVLFLGYKYLPWLF